MSLLWQSSWPQILVAEIWVTNSGANALNPVHPIRSLNVSAAFGTALTNEIGVRVRRRMSAVGIFDAHDTDRKAWLFRGKDEAKR